MLQEGHLRGMGWCTLLLVIPVLLLYTSFADTGGATLSLWAANSWA